MDRSRRDIFRAIRIFLGAIFLVGVVAIAFYPFDNRNLKLHFVTDDMEFLVEKSNDEIVSGDCREIKFDEHAESVLVKKVRIYGKSKTMAVKEIGYDELLRYIESVDQGEVRWTDKGISITGVDNIHFFMNEEFIEVMRKVSKSFLQERIVLAGFYFCLIAGLMLVTSIAEEKRIGDSWNNHGPVYETKKFWHDIVKYRQYMVYAAKTDLKAEVANSYLNRLWWLLEPFFNMVVYVIVFGNVMGNSVENYATFVFSALLMWNFFSKTVNYSVKLVRNNKDIITRVYIPKFVLLLSNMILNMFKLLFSLIVLVAMLLIFRVEVGFNIFWVLPAYVVLVLLAFGVGMIFLHFGVYIDDLSYAVGILLNMLMFLSGIFYETMTTLPDPLNTIMMSLNPVAVVIDTMRNALLNNSVSNLPLLAMWFLVSVIFCCIGIHIVYSNENSYVKVV